MKFSEHLFFAEHLLATASFCNSFTQFHFANKFNIYFFKTSFVRKIDKNSQSCRFFYLQIHFILYIVSVLYRSEDSYSQVCEFKGLIYRIYLIEKLTLALNMERLRKQSLPGSIRCRSNKL